MIAEKLDALEHLRPVFEAVQAVSEHFEGVYLVGGAVRDVLMGEPNFDVDIAVEGDGIAFGEALAEALGGRVVPHDRFGTAIVVHDGGRVDVATARTEFYDSPGALPTVEQASIRQDLYRRDFTINAMAASLRGEDFGRLVDHFGGLQDLENGVVRVLHNLSFIDDPTRIFRAIRYENRYGLAMDAHTLALARACVEMNLVGELSSSRLRDELQALLSEERVDDSVRRLAELGIDRAIHPHLAADEESVRLIGEIDRAREQLVPATPAWRLRLAVLARRLPPDELYEWFERLKLRRRDADRIADAVAVGPRLPELLAETEEPAAVRAIVEPHDPDGALFAYALAGDPARSRLERYFGDLRQVGLEISGDDLAALGLAGIAARRRDPRRASAPEAQRGARRPRIRDRSGEGAHRHSGGARVKLFEPDLGDGYFGAFSTRQGGVSEGDFDSLNLGILTDDEPDRVVENRRILGKAVGADPETATMAWQVHGARVFEADGRGVVTPGADFEQGDGLWTEKPGRALGLLTADCFPVVLARRNGTPRLVVLHVGWRGLVDGILENGVAAVAGTVAAAIGPGIGALLLRGGG